MIRRINMNLLYSNILPLGTDEGQNTIIDTFNEQLTLSDKVDIAVGYVSRSSLDELERLVDQSNIKNICLIIGMYFVEGMPEGSYHTALKLNKKWQESGVGEIRIVKTFKYHGKLYAFYKDSLPYSAILGSANLGVIKPEANNRRQYEISAITTEQSELTEITQFLDKLKAPNISSNIADIAGMPLIHETNTALSGIELVTTVPQSNIDFYRRCSAYLILFQVSCHKSFSHNIY